MIIHCSKDFTKRYKCRMSLAASTVSPPSRIDSWSAHIFKRGPAPVVIFMHDASLWALIIPATGITRLEQLLPLFLSRVQEVWRRHGASFDPRNQSILFLPRKARSLIGSMNDAIQNIKLMADIGRAVDHPVHWVKLEDSIQNTPFSAIDYDSPERRLKAILGG
ncbi:DUF6933 domain-containing protein [Prosthecobacter sp.]